MWCIQTQISVSKWKVLIERTDESNLNFGLKELIIVSHFNYNVDLEVSYFNSYTDDWESNNTYLSILNWRTFAKFDLSDVKDYKNLQAMTNANDPIPVIMGPTESISIRPQSGSSELLSRSRSGSVEVSKETNSTFDQFCQTNQSAWVEIFESTKWIPILVRKNNKRCCCNIAFMIPEWYTPICCEFK